MSQFIPLDSRLHRLLERLDADLALEARRAGCPSCGGVLHSARYPRKPRGGPDDLDRTESYRFSFCCDACRCRTTPASVRYLGRKVYFAAVVLLVTALRQGASPPGFCRLREILGVDRRTLERWRVFWLEIFPLSRVWREVRGLFVPPVVERHLPLSLLERFTHALARRTKLVKVLRLLSPVTIPARYGAVLAGRDR